MTSEFKKRILLDTAFCLLAAAFIYICIKMLIGSLLPFAVAAAVTVSLRGTVERLNASFGIKKKAAAVGLVLLVYFGALLTVVLLAKALFSEIGELMKYLPEYGYEIKASMSEMRRRLDGLLGNSPEFARTVDGMVDTAVKTAAERLAALVTDAAAATASAVPTFLFSLVVTLIAGIYFSKDYDKIRDSLKSILPKNVVGKIKRFKETVLSKLGKLLKGYGIIIIMTFTELSLGLLLLRVKYALLIAAVTALIDILPVLGSGTVLIPWSIFSALVGNTGAAVGLAVLYVVITVVRNFAEPKIIGKGIGLHPLLSLALMFLGFRLFGAAGLFIAPIAAVTVKSFREIAGTSED